MTQPDAIAELLRTREAAKDAPPGCIIWNNYRRAAMDFIRSPAFAEMVKDAERLDWITSHPEFEAAFLPEGWRVYDHRLEVAITKRHKTARAAIDAAIAKEKPRG